MTVLGVSTAHYRPCAECQHVPLSMNKHVPPQLDTAALLCGWVGCCLLPGGRRSRQGQVLARKRREYLDMVPEFYDVENSERTEDEIGALRQVRGWLRHTTAAQHIQHCQPPKFGTPSFSSQARAVELMYADAYL